MSKVALLEILSSENNISTFDQKPFAVVIDSAQQQQEQTRFITLTKEHARQVAKLHIEGISTGFISSLGLDFVTALYEAIIESKQSYGIITDDGRVVGFVAFTSDVGKLYKSVIRRNGLRFGLLLARKMFSLQRVKKVVETILYPNRAKKLNLPSAELLSIVVAPEARRGGQATELIMRGLDEYRKGDIDQVKVLVAAANEPANRLYMKCGFELVEQVSSHGVPSNIYVATIAQTRPVTQPAYAEEFSTLEFLRYTVDKLRPVAAAILIGLIHLFRS